MGWTPLGEKRKVRGMVVPECLAGGGCVSGSFCRERLGKEGFVPHIVGGTPAFIVSLLISVWGRRRCRATNWRAVLATASGLWSDIAPLMKPWCAEKMCQPLRT